MGIVNRIFRKKDTEIKEAKDFVRESVHKDKEEFTGTATNTQNRIDQVLEKTDKLQEDFRNSIAFKISIRTGRNT